MLLPVNDLLPALECTPAPDQLVLEIWDDGDALEALRTAVPRQRLAAVAGEPRTTWGLASVTDHSI